MNPDSEPATNSVGALGVRRSPDSEAHLSRGILEKLAETCQFDESPGSGIAFQVDIEDAVGLTKQIGTISNEIEDQI